jgi:hypothetical protein
MVRGRLLAVGRSSRHTPRARAPPAHPSCQTGGKPRAALTCSPSGPSLYGSRCPRTLHIAATPLTHLLSPPTRSQSYALYAVWLLYAIFTSHVLSACCVNAGQTDGVLQTMQSRPAHPGAQGHEPLAASGAPGRQREWAAERGSGLRAAVSWLATALPNDPPVARVMGRGIVAPLPSEGEDACDCLRPASDTLVPLAAVAFAAGGALTVGAGALAAPLSAAVAPGAARPVCASRAATSKRPTTFMLHLCLRRGQARPAAILEGSHGPTRRQMGG